MDKWYINYLQEVFNQDGSRLRKTPDGKIRKINPNGSL